MNLFDNIPLDAVADDLRKKTDQASGVEGALLGAGLGVVTTVATMRATAQKLTVPKLLAGAALGLAYGVADKRLIRGK